MNTAEMFVSGLDVKKDLDTSRICSFRAGGKISLAVYPKTPGDLRLLVSDTPYTILGGMTDVAVSDDGYDGTVVFSSALRGVEVDGDYAYIGSGERLPKVATTLTALGYSGLENLIGIPGTVGGATFMNAGAFGRTMGELVEEVVVFDLSSGESYRLKKEELIFSYRRSSIRENRELITGVKLRLKESSPEKTVPLAEEYKRRRKETQPTLPSLGSTFKNPLRTSAGALIDKVGLKGVRWGGAEVSELHANFIVNREDALVSDLIKLKNEVKRKVFDECGVMLEEEIKILK